MHAVVTERPDWSGYTEQLDQLEAARVRSARERASKVAADQEKLAAWQQAREQALLTGDPLPPTPDLDVLAVDTATLTPDGHGGVRLRLTIEAEYAARLRQVRDQQHALLATIAPEVEADAQDVERDLLTRTLQTKVGDLEPIRQEMQDLVLTVRETRFAWHGPDPHGEKPGTLTRQKITLSDLVQAATERWSLLAPVPKRDEPRTVGVTGVIA
jgi:hypothetical protein